MRTMFALITCAIASFPFGAQAAVSDDLVFCSKLTSPRERIACYDAAARIAANQSARPVSREHTPGTTAMVAREASNRSVPAADAPVPDRNKFDGFYAAVGGAYGRSSERAVGFLDYLTCGNSGCVGSTNASGWSGHAVAGYNITFGRGLLGLEFDGRWGQERGGTAGSNTGSFGIFIPTPPFLVVLPVASAWAQNIEVTGGAHISARAGIAIENLLIYAKAGVGVSRVEETFSLTQTPVPSLPSQSGSIRTVSWLPVGLFGVGAEYNMGSFFVRTFAEAELIGLGRRTGSLTANTFGYSTDAEPFWMARVGALIGVRF